MDKLRLASFPLFNPNPVLEVDYKGDIIFENPATKKILNKIDSTLDSSVFVPSDFSKIIMKSKLKKINVTPYYRELKISNRFFAEDLYLVKRYKSVRIYVHDITFWKKTELLLKKSRERLKKTESIAHLGSWEYDVKKQKLVWSDEVYNIFGVRAGKFNVSYEAFLDMIHPDDREAVDRAYSESILLKKKCYEIEHRIIKKDTGETRYLHEKCQHVLDKTGRVIRSFGMVQDVTWRVALEKQKDEFIDVASHELKTPLTTIKAFAQILNKKYSASQDDNFSLMVKRIDYQVDRLSRLVQDLLDATKIRHGVLVVKKDIVEIDKIIDEVISGIHSVSYTKRDIVFDDRSGNIILADKERISQVIHNLLTNAVEFSPADKKIIVKTKTNGKYMMVSVKDFGIGIPKDIQKHIFLPYFQANPSHLSSGKLSSLGLGLFISSEVIKRHGGKLWLESDEGRGSVFYFTLPYNK